jgi:hypothetical protein
LRSELRRDTFFLLLWLIDDIIKLLMVINNMNSSEKKLNIDYAALQAVYWTLSGVIFCFSTVFLQFKGYSNYEIGIIFALSNALSFVLQPLVAGHVDRSNKRALLGCIRITAALSLLLMLAVLMLPKNCLPLTAAYVLLLAGNTLLQPLCISLSLYLESWGCRINFSIARAVGSFSYALSTVVLGMLVQSVSENSVPIAYIIFSFLLGLITLLFSVKEKKHRTVSETSAGGESEKPSGIMEFIRENRRFMLFLAGTALLFFTHSLIGNFMIEFIRNIGGDSADLGNVLAFMTVVEVPVMLLFPRLTRRFRCSSLLRFAVIMFTVKELLIYLAPSLAILYAAELLQAFSFAIFVPASVRYVDEVIVKRNAVKGQAFVTAMITLGSIFASYLGGLLLNNSSPSFTLLTGVIVSAAGTLVMLFAIQKTE